MKRTIIITALLMFSSASLAHAQARVQGVVKNEEGRAVAGATITLFNPEAPKSAVSPIKTGKRGKWAALLPMGGQWDIDVEAEGYVTSRGRLQISEVGRTPPLETTLQKVPEAQPSEQEQVESSVPKEAVAAVEAGEAFMKKQQWAEAAAELEKAHELLPEHVQIKQVLAQVYYQLERKTDAMALLEQVHAEQPDNVGVALLLANLYLEEGELEKGKEVLSAVPDESLSDPTVLVNVAILFLNRMDQKEAIHYLDRAVALAPDFSSTYYYLGLVYLQMGNADVGGKDLANAKKHFELARKNLEKVIELGPETPEAAEAQELMDQIDISMKNI